MTKTGIIVDTTNAPEDKKRRLYKYLNRNGWSRNLQCLIGDELSGKVQTLIIQGASSVWSEWRKA